MNIEEIQAQLEQAKRDRNKIDEEVKRLESQLKIQSFHVGQIFRLPNNPHPLCMITCDCRSGYILTIIGGGASGCFSSNFQNKPLTHGEMLDKLNELNAVYIGHFEDIFEEKSNG